MGRPTETVLESEAFVLRQTSGKARHLAKLIAAGEAQVGTMSNPRVEATLAQRLEVARRFLAVAEK